MNELSDKLEEKKLFDVTVEKISFKIPDDLFEFLNRTGGASGEIGIDNYINLYSFSEIINYNKDYSVSEFLPGYLLIGTVNDEALVIDNNSNYYVVPFIGMFEKYCVKIAEGFEDMLRYLSKYNMSEK